MRQRVVLVTLIVAVAVAGVGIFGWKFAERHGSLEFTLIFDDAKNVHEGQFVMYNGVRIGTVTGVRLGEDNKAAVSVAIDSEHRSKVYSEAIFVIESPTLINVSGEKQVTMKDVGTSRTRVQPGAVLEGTNGTIDQLRRMAQEKLQSLFPDQQGSK